MRCCTVDTLGFSDGFLAFVFCGLKLSGVGRGVCRRRPLPSICICSAGRLSAGNQNFVEAPVSFLLVRLHAFVARDKKVERER